MHHRRAPASGIREEVPLKEGRAEPQLELWIESARAVSPAESARAAAEARAALEAAVAEDRGFFARDETVLELTWVDRRSGAPLRVKTVRAGIDPRDARKVRRLLDEALADGRGWAPAGGAE